MKSFRSRQVATIWPALVLSLVLLPGRAAADEPPSTTVRDGPDAEAKLAFEHGIQLLRAGAWASAAASFRRSLALVPRQSTMYDLAFALFMQHRVRESLQILTDLQNGAGSANDDSKYRKYSSTLLPH